MLPTTWLQLLLCPLSNRNETTKYCNKERWTEKKGIAVIYKHDCQGLHIFRKQLLALESLLKTAGYHN